MSEYGGGPQAFFALLRDYSSAEVDLAFYTILRRRQMENLRHYDDDEHPSIAVLQGYKSRFPADVNYYNYDGQDLFYELGEWLRDKNIARRLENEQVKKENEKRKARDAFSRI